MDVISLQHPYFLIVFTKQNQYNSITVRISVTID